MFSLIGDLHPGSSRGYWLVHIVVPPMGIQTPSAPWVLSLAPSLGTLCSVQYMAVIINFCICQALAEPLRKTGSCQQAPVCLFLLDIFFIYISSAIPKVPYTLPLPAPLPTHSHFLTLAFPCTEAYKVCNTKGPLFPVMDD